jgi:hypothetical protein
MMLAILIAPARGQGTGSTPEELSTSPITLPPTIKLVDLIELAAAEQGEIDH